MVKFLGEKKFIDGDLYVKFFVQRKGGEKVIDLLLFQRWEGGQVDVINGMIFVWIEIEDRVFVLVLKIFFKDILKRWDKIVDVVLG